MISKFVTVYPGHIDMPDMGQEATPANDRNFSNDQLARVFEKMGVKSAVELAQRLKAIGR